MIEAIVELMELFNKYYLTFKKYFTTPFIFYIGWIIIHYISVQLYGYWCSYLSLVGFITSPFAITTPICRGLEWCIHNGSNIIQNMWVIIGSWFVTKVVTTTYTPSDK